MMEALRIGSMNVRGLSNGAKRVDVFNWLKSKNFSIYCLQDVHVGPKYETNFIQDWGHEVVLSSSSSESRGVAVLFRPGLDYKIQNINRDIVGNLLILDLEVCGTHFVLAVIYGPNKDQPDFYSTIRDYLTDKVNKPIIICGDWNLVLDFNIDTYNYVCENNVNSRKAVEEIMSILDLTDTWRSSNPLSKKYTWVSSTKPAKMARLDFFLVSPDIHAKTVKHFLSFGYRTDHSFTGIEINISDSDRGKGFWKFNTSLLHDQEFVKIVKAEIKKTVAQYTTVSNNKDTITNISKQLLFEMIKLNIRGVTIPYSSKIKKKRNEQEKQLEIKIKDLEDKLALLQNQNVSEIVCEIQKCKENLQEIRQKSVQGVILRSKTKLYALNEKPTKYFCNLEKKNSVNKTIYKVNTRDSILTEPRSILSELKRFYNNLYKSSRESSASIQNQFLNANLKTLDNEQKELCEGKLKVNEVKIVLKSMANGKSPGSDGYPAEFYKFFWQDIGEYLMNSLNEAFEVGELSHTQKQGVITLLPKGDKPREFIKNWRPISLINVDCKLLSGVLAHRLKKVLPKIIGNEQKGFLKNRYIGENIRTVYDLMEYLETSNKNGMLLLLDFEKAFDSIEWDYLNKVLGVYGFGPQFIKWFNVLYKNVSSCVLNNGHFSEFFQLGRSCRQGDPLSPYLFILAIEPLAVEFKNNNKIGGIKCGEKTIKVGLYADDTFLMLDGSESSLRESISVLNSFYICSGLKINLDKTQAIWLGKLKATADSICADLNLNWAKKFKLLGINFSVDLEEIVDLNYREKLLDIEKLFNLYRRFNLSIVGKITVIKTLALPKLVYLLSVLPTPDKKLLNKIDQMISNFLWEGKPKVARLFLERDINEGGLKLTNIFLFNFGLKLTWVKRIIENSGNWQTIFNLNLSSSNVKSCFELDTESLQCFIRKTSNNFWKDVFGAWVEYKKEVCETIDPRTFSIWDSYYIKNNNLIKRSQEFQDNGIKHLNDLISPSGGLFGYEDFFRTFNLQINFVDFYSLLHSIPTKWKGQLQERLDTSFVHQDILEQLLKMNKVCQETYKHMLHKNSRQRSHETKWGQIFQCPPDMLPWRKYYSLNFNCTIDSKMRAFQYRLLLRIIPTNKYLKVCDIIDDDRCYFCHSEIETIEHLFFLCPLVKELWVKLAEKMKPYLDITFFLEPHIVLLGCIETEHKMCLNHIFNIVKKYIYSVKCNERNLCLQYLLRIIKLHYQIERNLVLMYNKNLEIFTRKWQPIESMLLE